MKSAALAVRHHGSRFGRSSTEHMKSGEVQKLLFEVYKPKGAFGEFVVVCGRKKGGEVIRQKGHLTDWGEFRKESQANAGLFLELRANGGGGWLSDNGPRLQDGQSLTGLTSSVSGGLSSRVVRGTLRKDPHHASSLRHSLLLPRCGPKLSGGAGSSRCSGSSSASGSSSSSSNSSGGLCFRSSQRRFRRPILEVYTCEMVNHCSYHSASTGGTNRVTGNFGGCSSGDERKKREGYYGTRNCCWQQIMPSWQMGTLLSGYQRLQRGPLLGSTIQRGYSKGAWSSWWPFWNFKSQERGSPPQEMCSDKAAESGPLVAKGGTESGLLVARGGTEDDVNVDYGACHDFTAAKVQSSKFGRDEEAGVSSQETEPPVCNRTTLSSHVTVDELSLLGPKGADAASAGLSTGAGTGPMVSSEPCRPTAAVPVTPRLPHVPVLLADVVNIFEGRDVRVLVDCTLGAGGHASEIIKAHPELHTFVGIDADPLALAMAAPVIRDAIGSATTACHVSPRGDSLSGTVSGQGDVLSSDKRTCGQLGGNNFDATTARQEHVIGEGWRGEECNGVQVHLLQGNFRDLTAILSRLGLENSADGILLDLGMSSMQVDDAERGFSFLKDGPLDMRMDPSTGYTAEVIVNESSEQELGHILWTYGEERKWRWLAGKIVQARQKCRITTTKQLADIIGGGGYRPRGSGKKGSAGRGIHPATRVFQALRIAVNDELCALEDVIPAAASCLAIGGRIGVISFHSLEDRIVKHIFRAAARPDHGRPSEDLFQYTVGSSGWQQRKVAGGEDLLAGKIPGLYRDWVLEPLTKSPIIASEDARKQNPRSRSAKLRVAQKTPCQPKERNQTAAHTALKMRAPTSTV